MGIRLSVQSVACCCVVRIPSRLPSRPPLHFPKVRPPEVSSVTLSASDGLSMPVRIVGYQSKPFFIFSTPTERMYYCLSVRASISEAKGCWSRGWPRRSFVTLVSTLDAGLPCVDWWYYNSSVSSLPSTLPLSLLM